MWTVCDYSNSDFSGILLLTKEFYGDIEISDENYIKWEYFENPAGEAIIKVAKNETGEIVGQYILISINMRVFGKQLKASLSLNTLTKNEYLRQGIFTTTSENAFNTCKTDGYAFTYGYPNQNSYYGFIDKLNFTDLHKVPLLIYPCDLKSLIKKRVGKVISMFVPNIFFSLKRKVNDSNIIEIKENNIHLLDDFWHVIKNKYPIMVVRDARFIRWRYLDIPIRKYSIYAYVRETKIYGYIITTTKEVEDIQNGMIVDFLVLGDEFEVGRLLIYKCFEMFKKNNVELLGCLMLEHTIEYQILRKCGFLKTPRFIEPQPFPLIYRSHQEEYNTEQMKNIENWFVSMGDYDAV